MRNFEDKREPRDDLASEESGSEYQAAIVGSRWWKWISGIIGAVIILTLILPLFSCGGTPSAQGNNDGAIPSPIPNNSSSATDQNTQDLHAPDFSLMDSNNNTVNLANLLTENRAVVIVFYRGFF